MRDRIFEVSVSGHTQHAQGVSGPGVPACGHEGLHACLLCGNECAKMIVQGDPVPSEHAGVLAVLNFSVQGPTRPW